MEIAVLKSLPAGSRSEQDRLKARDAARSLANDAAHVYKLELLVENGAISALANHLQPLVVGNDAIPFEFEVEEECVCALSRIAKKSEYAQLIVDGGHLPTIVNLLKRCFERSISVTFNGAICRAIDAIANIAYSIENAKTIVRNCGTIPVLLGILKLDTTTIETQISITIALRILASQNEDNVRQIVECDALSALVTLLQVRVTYGHQHQVLTLFETLVDEFPDTQQNILQAGALQPIINLLRSDKLEIQISSAKLIGDFADPGSECLAHIAQSGAIQYLVELLRSSNIDLKEAVLYALARNAQDTHNQAGIANCGGISPLLECLYSINGTLQYYAAETLYAIVNNEDNVPDFVMFGGVIRLLEGNWVEQRTRDCVSETLIRLKEKMCGQVLNRTINLMTFSLRSLRMSIALGLAHICSPGDLKRIYFINNGLNHLLDLMNDNKDSRQQQLSAEALSILERKADGLLTARDELHDYKVCPGEQQIYNDENSDVKFNVEGREFYAHKQCLVASSEAFYEMFCGGSKEVNDKNVTITNVKKDVFELMMRYVYTGHVDISSKFAKDLLLAADQYLLDGLKHLCESAIAKDICFDNLMDVYEFSTEVDSDMLKRSCLRFILSNFKQMHLRSG